MAKSHGRANVRSSVRSSALAAATRAKGRRRGSIDVHHADPHSLSRYQAFMSHGSVTQHLAREAEAYAAREAARTDELDELKEAIRRKKRKKQRAKRRRGTRAHVGGAGLSRDTLHVAGAGPGPGAGAGAGAVEDEQGAAAKITRPGLLRKASLRVMVANRLLGAGGRAAHPTPERASGRPPPAGGTGGAGTGAAVFESGLPPPLHHVHGGSFGGGHVALNAALSAERLFDSRAAQPSHDDDGAAPAPPHASFNGALRELDAAADARAAAAVFATVANGDPDRWHTGPVTGAVARPGAHANPRRRRRSWLHLRHAVLAAGVARVRGPRPARREVVRTWKCDHCGLPIDVLSGEFWSVGRRRVHVECWDDYELDSTLVAEDAYARTRHVDEAAQAHRGPQLTHSTGGTHRNDSPWLLLDFDED